MRVRRFRQSRDLTAAMQLRIGDLEDSEEEEDGAANADKSGSDSVFSASTAVTASEVGADLSARTMSRSVSRELSANEASMMTNTSKEEVESEPGYASDAVSNFVVGMCICWQFELGIFRWSMIPKIEPNIAIVLMPTNWRFCKPNMS